MPTPRLWLVRHGQTDWNVAGRVQGQTPTDLNDAGREQARQLAASLRSHPFAAIWTSDLPRAFSTAEILAEGRNLPLQQSTLLRERNFGPHEGRTAAEVRIILNAAQPADGSAVPHAAGDLANWIGVPGVESNTEVWTRTESFLRNISTQHAHDENILVVTHGGVLARAVYNALGIPESSPRRFTLSNALVLILQLKLDSFHLLSLVDYPLALSGTTTLDTATTKTAD